jgi:hypothetical protein
MTNFRPQGTSQPMTVHDMSGRTYDVEVYSTGASGLGICKTDPDATACTEWYVVHRSSGLLIARCTDGYAATSATHAAAHAVSLVNCFWVNDLETITGNPEAMRRARDAIRVYMAR